MKPSCRVCKGIYDDTGAVIKRLQGMIGHIGLYVFIAG